eukprot:Blabericola_migrator_1__324@NODE_1083_length_5494_cov_146_902340_g742_i0_p3_GENE_NODE_1083_length_5494_cov_146_902340_g742_i0NODE_1083_length_5494_cov_146_902340_g742_i0_p3_ORF_typecomplete_len261_score14_37RRM_1/PF00076_22/4_7e08RRM_3/PF08777_11/4_2e07Limkainb1/PF11608_8/6_1e05RRM_5/PF13893_6/6_4e05DNA_pol3_a_NII/PF11490_8/0_013_NODE_1083_length_5494_cov_146_902340_g742_i031663948
MDSRPRATKFRNKSVFERMAGGGERRAFYQSRDEDEGSYRRGFYRGGYQPMTRFSGRRGRSFDFQSRPYSPSSRRVTLSSSDGPPSGDSTRRSFDGDSNRNKSWHHDRFEGQATTPGSTVFIRGLSKDVSEVKLKQLFQNAGCEVCMLKIERAPLTTAVVGFTRRDAATKAVDKVHNTHFMGETIRVMIWERDEEAMRRAVIQRQQQEREEEEQIRQELEAMQTSDIEGKLRWAKDNSSSNHQITLASQTPKRSVFERVS